MVLLTDSKVRNTLHSSITDSGIGGAFDFSDELHAMFKRPTPQCIKRCIFEKYFQVNNNFSTLDR